MRDFKIFAIIITISLLFMACNQTAPIKSVSKSDIETDAINESNNESNPESDHWARENFDLQALEPILKESDNIEDFERRINANDGINNLDLNGDGYVDYISVREYGDDNYDDRRGLSLVTRFGGPDEIQEIANIIFNRDPVDQGGTRILLSGNEQIYGRNYYYGGNWVDKSLAIADFIFNNRDNNDYYSSPYYYNTYPDYYDTYPVVQTPVYRERVTKYMVNPAMTKITTPTTKIMIKSPYAGRSYRRVYARMAEPTDEQRIFIKNNRKPPKFKDKKDLIKTSAKAEKNNKGKDFDKPGKAKKVFTEKIKDKKPVVKRKDVKVNNPRNSSPPKAGKGKKDKQPKPKTKGNGGGKGKGKNKGKN